MYWNEDIDLSVKDEVLWLTLTWDVLKYSFSFASASSLVININMRCIEMQYLPEHSAHIT